MSTLTLRTAKGSPLTNAEVDANFTNILVALGGTNAAPYTLPTPPAGGGTIVLSNSPTFSGTVSMGDGATATRFPNAGAIVSDVTTNQQNLSANIGLLGETKATTTTSTATGTSGANTISISAANPSIVVGQGVVGSGIAPNATVTAINGTTVTLSANNTGAVTGTTTFADYAYGLYGSGYTSGVGLSSGMAGVGRVSSSLDTGNAIGVTGTALDAHAGGSNIGLYADASGGATNYALYVNRGSIYSPSTLNISAPSLGLPTGTTGTRPGTAAAGNLRFNTDLAVFEGYNGAKWGSIGGGGLTATAIQITHGYTAAANDLVRCNTTGGAFSITLPASPTDGDIVGVVDTHGTFNTYNLTILAAGSKTIEGDATSLILDMNASYISLVYNSVNSNWRILETPTGVGTFTTPVKVASYTASVGDLVRCDTTLGSFTVTLPTSPADGSIVNIVDVAGTFYTYNLNVARGGSNTVEGDTLVYLDINGTYASFVYNATGTNWKLLQTPYGVLGNVTSTVTLAGITKGTGKDLTNAVAGTDYQTPIGTISGLAKGNGANLLTNAVAGTDYQTPIGTISGLAKGNGANLLTAAVAGTDYQVPIGTISGLAKGNGANALTVATAGTDYLAPPTGTSLLKANSGGALANAVAGTDYLAAVAPGTSGNVLTSNGSTWVSTTFASSNDLDTTFVAAGSITQGKAVVLNSTGTVSQSIISALSTGSSTTFNAAITLGSNAIYHPTSGQYLLFYTDATSNLGYVVAVTISENTPTFGTPYTWSAAVINGSQISLCWDSVTNQVIVGYVATSRAMLVTVAYSGGTFSKGTAVQNPTAHTSTNFCAVCYDKSVSAICVTYQNSSTQYASYATVSGTSISWTNTAASVGANNSGYGCSAVYCDALQINAIAYNDVGRGQLQSIKFTGSGTLTMASGVRYQVTDTTGASNGYFTGARSIAWANDIQRIIAIYDGGNNNGYYLMSGVYSFNSGTNYWVVTASSVINTGSYGAAYQWHRSISYHSISGHAVISWQLDTNGFGKIGVSDAPVLSNSLNFSSSSQWQSSATDMSLVTTNDIDNKSIVVAWDNGNIAGNLNGTCAIFTMPNPDKRGQFIGFAQSTVSNGQNVTIRKSFGVDTNQTGLVPGTRYYLSSSDGSTLSTTVNGPNVGRAISNTSLQITGSITVTPSVGNYLTW